LPPCWNIFGFGPDQGLAQVLKMETQVLNFFGFQIIAPTAKTFLRCCYSFFNFHLFFIFIVSKNYFSFNNTVASANFCSQEIFTCSTGIIQGNVVGSIHIYACFRGYQPLLIKK
jgi:hypothetical protein